MKGLAALGQAGRGEGEGVDQPARRRVEEWLEPGRSLRLVADHAGLHGGGDHLPPGVLMVEDVADGRLGPQRAVGRRRVGGLPGVGGGGSSLLGSFVLLNAFTFGKDRELSVGEADCENLTGFARSTPGCASTRLSSSL